jgi:hypothetical protein
MTTSPKATTGPVIFGREMDRLGAEYYRLAHPAGQALMIVRAHEPKRGRPLRWSVGRYRDPNVLLFGDSATIDGAAREMESSIRSLVLSLVPLLDDSAKREVARAMNREREFDRDEAEAVLADLVANVAYQNLPPQSGALAYDYFRNKQSKG